MATSLDQKVLNKLLAFEYVVLSMVEWQTSQEYQSSLDQFRTDSNFNQTKVLLFPFFISTVHESRNVLFKLFDRFYPAEEGHIEWDVLKNLSALRYIDVQPQRLDFKDRHFTLQQLQAAREEIKKELNAQPEVVTAIDNAIEVLRYKTKNFVNFDSGSLTYFSRRHISWRLYWDHTRRTGSLPVIHKDILIDEVSELYLPSRKIMQNKIQGNEALVGHS